MVAVAFSAAMVDGGAVVSCGCGQHVGATVCCAGCLSPSQVRILSFIKIKNLGVRLGVAILQLIGAQTSECFFSGQLPFSNSKIFHSNTAADSEGKSDKILGLQF